MKKNILFNRLNDGFLKGGDRMIRSIVKDEKFLAKKCKPATKKDLAIGQDLLDTLRANQSVCIGMAANMIGQQKNIIVVHTDLINFVMYNPRILQKQGEYETSEGCLSLKGVRQTKRYQHIRVQYYDATFHKQVNDFSGLVAQTIQHEVDHCNGILI